MLNKFKAFSLIELMVVVIIIGITLGFAVPSYLKSIERSKDKEAKLVLQRAMDYLRNIELKYGTYYHNGTNWVGGNPISYMEDFFETPLVSVFDSCNFGLMPHYVRPNWCYSITIPGGSPNNNLMFLARRNNTGGGPNLRTWMIYKNGTFVCTPAASPYCN